MVVLFKRHFSHRLGGLPNGSILSEKMGHSAILNTSNLPVDKGPLGIHEVKLVVKSGPGLSNSRGVAQHAESALDLGQISSRDNSRGLVVDAHLGSRTEHVLDIFTRIT